MRKFKRAFALLLCLATLCALLPVAVTAAETDTAKIMADLAVLPSGSWLPYQATLTGKITKVTEVYSSQYKNITVVIEIPGYPDQPITCYRMKGTGADELDIGYVITVSGDITNYNGTIEFSSNKNLDKAFELVEIVQRGVEAPEDPKEIVDAAFALAPNESLPYTATLVGQVTEITEAYSTQYKNMTLKIQVEGSDGMKIIECYRLTGEGADTIQVGDMISVTGIIKHFYKAATADKPELSKIEFDAKCVFEFYIAPPTDPKQIVDEAFALGQNEALPYEATLTGTVTEIVTEYDETYKNVSVNLEVEGSTGKKIIECYRMKADSADSVAVGDVITVTGTIKRYYKAATADKEEVDKIEFDAGCTMEKVAVTYTVSGKVNSGKDTTGTITVELWAEGADQTAYTVTTEDGNYTVENVAAGNYTVKISKVNHVTRAYALTVAEENVTLNGQICLLGDATQDGVVNILDVAKVYAHIKGIKLTDDYAIACADVKGGGTIVITEVAALYAHFKGTNKLY